jgi:hypothetical protein
MNARYAVGIDCNAEWYADSPLPYNRGAMIPFPGGAFRSGKACSCELHDSR